jgi:hypothetical protein
LRESASAPCRAPVVRGWSWIECCGNVAWRIFRLWLLVLASGLRIIRMPTRLVSALNFNPAHVCIYGAVAALIAGAIALTTSAQAAEKEKEAIAELELGVAGDWDTTGGTFSVGPSLGIEVTPIKDWLEIEAEVSPVFGSGRTEWETELIFKKPFEVSDKLEVMPGVGPAWFYKTGQGETGGSIGAVALLDLQLWPSAERKLGWFIEPSYGYDFGREHEQSLGITIGILIPLR